MNLQQGDVNRDVRLAATRQFQAFTRVEITLLLLVLTILVATVCPKIFSRNPNYDHSGARSILASIKTGLDAFQVDTGHYPAGTNGLLDLLRNSTGISNWHGPYLDSIKIPPDPWGRAYQSACPGKHNTDGYDLWSLGPPEGAPGSPEP
jgi:general secretion pathway protein G